MSAEHSTEVSILVGLLTMVMLNEWDGWLIAVDGTDRIEFWEGNVFFYSEDELQLAAAARTMDQFKLSRKAL